MSSLRRPADSCTILCGQQRLGHQQWSAMATGREQSVTLKYINNIESEKLGWSWAFLHAACGGCTKHWLGLADTRGAWVSLDKFTPLNKVLGCKTEGWFSLESTFTFIWVDNSAFSNDEDFIITFINTPSVERLRKLFYSVLKFHSRLSSLQSGFWEVPPGFWHFRLLAQIQSTYMNKSE